MDITREEKIRSVSLPLTNSIAIEETKVQLKQFMKTVYLFSDPKSKTYEKRLMTNHDLKVDLWKHTSLFVNESNSSFVNWCRAQKFEFLDTGNKRDHKGCKIAASRRELHVLKSGFRDDVLEEIVGVQEKFQNYISNLKEEGHSIIGYCRKSKTAGGKEEVVKSLQSMIEGLKSRSLAQHIYVTISCNSKTPLSRRDLKRNVLLNKLKGADGDAQDMIRDLKNLSKACLVVIDSAGLTTNMSDLDIYS